VTSSASRITKSPLPGRPIISRCSRSKSYKNQVIKVKFQNPCVVPQCEPTCTSQCVTAFITLQQAQQVIKYVLKIKMNAKFSNFNNSNSRGSSSRSNALSLNALQTAMTSAFNSTSSKPRQLSLSKSTFHWDRPRLLNTTTAQPDAYLSAHRTASTKRLRLRPTIFRRSTFTCNQQTTTSSKTTAAAQPAARNRNAKKSL